MCELVVPTPMIGRRAISLLARRVVARPLTAHASQHALPPLPNVALPELILERSRTFAPDSPAHVGGMEAGLTIVAVNDVLCPASAKEALKMIDAARAKKGQAALVCHLKKSKDDEDHV